MVSISKIQVYAPKPFERFNNLSIRKPNRHAWRVRFFHGWSSLGGGESWEEIVRAFPSKAQAQRAAGAAKVGDFRCLHSGSPIEEAFGCIVTAV